MKIQKINGIYVADNAVVVGDVRMGRNTNIWPFACVRGDVAPVRIGENCSIQDQTMLHCRHKVPLEIGDDVIIGHQACVHCRKVGSFTLVGIGAKLLDNCCIGRHCIVAAGAVVLPNTKVPDGCLVAGVPSRIIREVSEDDRSYMKDVIKRYIELAEDYASRKIKSVFPQT